MIEEQDKSGPEPAGPQNAHLDEAGSSGDAESGDPLLAQPEDKSNGRQVRGFGLWVRDMLFSLAISFFIITFLYQPVKVEGTSMLPRLEDQDRLFINKFVYHFEKIEHGDVVVFHYPRDPEKSYIKRVIALPGDDLLIDGGRVYLNGKLLPEPYVPRKFRDLRSQEEMVIPAGEYFLMGDHRSISSDSRDFGPVPRDLIYGKAAFVYWPAEDVGVVH